MTSATASASPVRTRLQSVGESGAKPRRSCATAERSGPRASSRSNRLVNSAAAAALRPFGSAPLASSPPCADVASVAAAGSAAPDAAPGGVRVGAAPVWPPVELERATAVDSAVKLLPSTSVGAWPLTAASTASSRTSSSGLWPMAAAPSVTAAWRSAVSSDDHVRSLPSSSATSSR